MKQEEVRKGTGQRQRQIQTKTNTIQTETNTKDRHARIHSLVQGQKPRQGRYLGRVQTINMAHCTMYDAHMRVRVSLKREKLKR